MAVSVADAIARAAVFNLALEISSKSLERHFDPLPSPRFGAFRDGITVVAFADAMGRRTARRDPNVAGRL